MHTKTQCKGKCIAHKQYEMGKWLEDQFYFKDTNEFIIFLLWGLFVSAFLLTIVR